MKTILERIQLEEKHYDLQNLEVPVVDASLYNVLGRRLYELYQKYNIETQDQRVMESLSFVLLSFNEQRKKNHQAKWRRWMPWKRRA